MRPLVVRSAHVAIAVYPPKLFAQADVLQHHPEPKRWTKSQSATGISAKRDDVSAALDYCTAPIMSHFCTSAPLAVPTVLRYWVWFRSFSSRDRHSFAFDGRRSSAILNTGSRRRPVALLPSSYPAASSKAGSG